MGVSLADDFKQVFTQRLHSEQGEIQGQFISWVPLIWIQSFSFF